MKKAVHFGAGNIGRGFIGLLLHQAGYEVVFADVVAKLIDELNQARAYRVLTLAATTHTETVRDVRGVLLDADDCVKEIVHAELVTTAVGMANLQSVARAIARGLTLRQQQNPGADLNILACENAIRATTSLKQLILNACDERLQAWIGEHVGFADVAVDRIAPNREGYALYPLDAVVERFFEWDIESSTLKGELAIPGATLVGELSPYLERKLFILNGAHVTAAYAGYRRNYATIREAMQDPSILQLVMDVQQEAMAGLTHRYASLSTESLATYAQSVRERFSNPYIHDNVERVGRDPLRKLSAHDRLVRPLQLARAAKCDTPALVTAIALGLLYDNEQDGDAMEMQKIIRARGLEAAVQHIIGLNDEGIVQSIVRQYMHLHHTSV